MKNENIKSKIRVVVAMSGGVDSSVAAYLLKKQGYDVIGIFLKLWTPPDYKDCCNIVGEALCGLPNSGDHAGSPLRTHKQNLCCDDKAMAVARQIADKLKIPFYVLKVDKLFKEEIVDNFISEYEQGRTPNPCVRCNKYIKFGYLWEKAKELGADYLSTGHYVSAKKVKDIRYSILDIKNQKAKNIQYPLSNISICRSKDTIKDQTYFLSSIDPKIIPHLLFPLGNMTKKEVRSIAKKAKITVYNKKDSMGVCFIPDGDMDAFLKHFSKSGEPGSPRQRRGDIVDKQGNVLGAHKGLLGYTVGQKIGDDQVAAKYHKFPNYPECNPNIPNGKSQTFRKEFGILGNDLGQLGKKNFDIPRLYVLAIDHKRNRLVVGENEDCFSKEMIVENLNVVNGRFWEMVKKKKIFYAQIRGGHRAEKCHVTNYPECYPNNPNNKLQTLRKEFGTLGINSGQLGIEFLKPVRAITPGQTVALYDKKILIGGGVIKK
ncbi:MAG: tRNA 2-thiouridine(34) synthase MnmA [Patescibacteria group bacterium]|nr:tRNA 2-thiouridine(34) synthase MnmA [Patescibacteria group bacterium]